MSAEINCAFAIIVGVNNGAAVVAFARALTALGWDVSQVANVETAVDWLDRRPTLIVFPVEHGTGDRTDEVARLRAGGGIAASVPTIALNVATVSDMVLSDRGFDDCIDARLSPAAQAEQANRWKPENEVATIARLEAVFGHDEIHTILLRFRAFLETALLALARGEQRDLAHRVAGAAGTVGFAAVGRAWNALSDGVGPGDDASDAISLYRHTRIAIATIDTILLAPSETPA